MGTIDAVAALITLAAFISYLNHRFLKLPATIGLMFLSLLAAIAVIGLDLLGVPAWDQAFVLVRGIDFSEILLRGMLGLLLFAGALHINLDDLVERWLEIGIFATAGVVVSTLLVGAAMYALSGLLGLGLTFLQSLLFGALISPTDPIAVLGILKRAGAPKSLEIKIAGESLFNDGIGVVIFLLLLELVAGEHEVTVREAGMLLAEEAVGGVLFGLAAGYLAYRLLKSVDDYQVEILITLALATGGYALANAIHVSAPLAMVVAGLLVGNHGRRLAMSELTREHIDTFWELVDGILNALLFVLIGLEVLVLSLSGRYLLAGAVAVPVALAARFLSVGGPVILLRRWREYAPNTIKVMTWGGLRGGISVALALSVPLGAHRELILTMTYVVVVFSILIQGLTVGKVVGRK